MPERGLKLGLEQGLKQELKRGLEQGLERAQKRVQERWQWLQGLLSVFRPGVGREQLEPQASLSPLGG